MTYELDIKHIYESYEDWEKDYELLEKNIEALEESEVNSFNSLEEFKSFLSLRLDTECLVDKVFSYLKRQVDIDNSLEDYKLKMKDVLKLYGKLTVIGNRLEESIILNSDKVLDFMKDSSLKDYLRYLEEIVRKKEHIINSSKYEKEISDYMSNLQDIRSKYQDILVNKAKSASVKIGEEEISVSKSNISELLKDENMENRKIFSRCFAGIFANYESEVAELLVSKYSQDIEMSKFKRFDSLLEEKMFDYDIHSDIFRKLVSTVNQNLFIKHDFNRLRKNILSLDKMYSYDSSLPICESANRKIEIEEGLSIIKNAISVLGKDYVSLVDRMFEEGWVSLYPKDGKVNRSYTSIAYFGVPYVITNYNNNISSLRILVHEIGHAENVFLSKQVNKSHDFDVSFFLTEVASKVNELLLDEYMLKNCSSTKEKNIFYIIV